MDGGFFTSNNAAFADPNTRIDVQQKKYDFKSELSQPFNFAEKLAMRLGYTDYFHTELVGGVPGIPYSPGTAFSNKSFEGRVELSHKDLGSFKGTVGFQAIASQLAAFDFPAGGVPTSAQNNLPPMTNIVPNTQSNSFGVFGLETISHGAMTYQLGGRLENTALTPNVNSSYAAPNGTSVAASYNYLPVSASASALWTLNASNSLNLAATRSQRAPQVQELFANGYHDATRSYELGDPNLQMETSYNLDLSYKFKTDWLRAEVDIFNNWANSYIFQQRTGYFVPQDYNPLAHAAYETAAQCGNDCTPVTTNRQANAIFRGYESKLVFPVAETGKGALDLTLFSDYTQGQFVSGGAVPRMPPLRFGFQWDYTENAWSGNLRFTRGQAQSHPGANDTTTAGYYLLTAGAQYQIKHFHDSNILLFLKGNNLLNENIRNSVSYLRNFAPEPGRGAEIGVRIGF